MKTITILALHLSYGGVEKYISSLCKMLHNDYKIRIISTYNNDNKTAFEFDKNVEIEYLIDKMPNKKELINALNKRNLVKIIGELIKSIKIIFLKYYRNIRAIKKINSDYIITTRIFHNNLVSKFANKKIIKIATEHNYHNDDIKYVSQLIKSVSKFDYFVVVSRELKEYYCGKIIEPKVIYIPNVLDSMPKAQSKLDKNNVISIGRFSKEKDFVTLLKVFKEVKKSNASVNLYLIGDGEESGNIKQYIKTNNLESSVILPGFLDQTEIEKYMLNSKIYVMTSITESFGLVLIEAMSYGLPCIAFDSASGARELIKNDKNGYLVSNRNIKKMADKIVELMNCKNIYNYSNEAQLTSKKYLIKNIKKIWIDLLEEKL